MRKTRILSFLLSLTALPGTALAAQTVVVTQSAGAATQTTEVVGHSARVGATSAVLELQFASGAEQVIAFDGGQILVGDVTVGTYTAGGALESAWRSMLSGSLSTPQLVAALHALPTDGLPSADLSARNSLMATWMVPSAPDGVEVPALAELAALGELADVSAEIAGARAEIANARDLVRSQIRNGIRNSVQVSVPQVVIAPGAAGPPISSVPGGLLALAGTLLALSGLALGTSFFAERQIDVMADTVQHSLARSFFVGLFAQPLILPALGALVVGLTLTIVGILVVPFAIAAFVALLAVGLVGGYLAVARATGATFLARRGQETSGGMSMVKSVVVGLGLLLALWLPAVLLGWVPVMGTILQVAAGILTWGLVTTGFGAAILTRGGVRGTFGQRFAPAPVPFSRPLTIPDEDESQRFSTSEWLAGEKRS